MHASVIGVAVTGGLIAAFAGAEPTGAAIDEVLVMLAVTLTVSMAAAAPWWVVLGAAGMATAVAFDPVVAAGSVVGVALAGWLAIGRRCPSGASVVAATSAAVTLNALLRSNLGGFFGLSAIVGVALGAALLCSGAWGRGPQVYRSAATGAATVAGIMVFAVGAAGWAGLSARADLSDGSRLALEGLDALSDGRYDDAADRFASSSDAFGAAHETLDGPRSKLALLVPVVSQNVAGATTLAGEAAATIDELAVALRSVDVGSLRVLDGAVDIDAIRAVEEPLRRVEGAIGGLRATRQAISSPWLIGRFQTELADLDQRLDDNEPLLDDAIEAVRLAPGLLGADGPRSYLVLFASPVEARGLAGFVGNYAIVDVVGGAIDVAEFGRRSDLDEATQRLGGARCVGCPEEAIDRYASAGLDIGAGMFGARGWTAITMPAHFPYVGEMAQIMYPQSGGDPIDGVISIDPYVLQALMRYTGPITIDDVGVTVTADNAADFLLEGQYLLLEDGTNTERIESIDTLGQQVISALLGGALPEPSELARDLGPLIAEQRLLVWTSDPAEQALLERVGLLGALPELGDDGGFGVMVTNQGQSKVDAFLDREVQVEIVDTDGARRLVADVTLTNNAPADGLPSVVIGNSFGFPSGSSYLWVSFFGPPGEATITRNGDAVGVSAAKPEAGWWATSFDELIGSGESVTYRVVYDVGPATDDLDEPVQWSQPLARRPS